MKRSKLFVLFTTALFLSIFALLSEANSAQAKKNNITYTVKKGTLTVVFNTKLDLSVLTSILCENFKVKVSDPNYKSIDGVIYSKDGTDIVRVPF